MDRSDYFVVQHWMVNELELKGNDLLIFAIIHGFSRDGSTQFTGSLSYLQKSINASRPTVIKSIKNLMSKGLIFQEQTQINGMTFNKYRASLQGSKETLPPVKDLNGGSKESLQGVVKNLNRGSKESLPNNIINNINNNIINNKPILEIDLEEVEDGLKEYFQIAKAFVGLFKKNVEEKGGLSAKISRMKFAPEVKSIRLAMTKDGITTEQFQQIFKYLDSPEGDFWKSNIMSCYKLRLQANKLLVQSNTRKNGKQTVTAESKLSKIQQAIAISNGAYGSNAGSNSPS